MSTYNNPNDPNRDRASEPAPTGPQSDVRRTDHDDRGSSIWPWIIGLLVLLAVGWIVIEAFDNDDAGVNDAVPAAGTMDDDGLRDRDTTLDNDPTMTPGDTAQPGMATPPADTGASPNNAGMDNNATVDN